MLCRLRPLPYRPINIHIHTLPFRPPPHTRGPYYITPHTHTHTRTHARTHARTHTHMHARTHAPLHPPHTPARTNSHTRARQRGRERERESRLCVTTFSGIKTLSRLASALRSTADTGNRITTWLTKATGNKTHTLSGSYRPLSSVGFTTEHLIPIPLLFADA